MKEEEKRGLTHNTSPLDKESSLHILSGLVRQIELGFVVPNEEWQRDVPDYCKNFKENIAPIYRAAINILAGLDQSASWIETAGFPKKDDSQTGCT